MCRFTVTYNKKGNLAKDDKYRRRKIPTEIKETDEKLSVGG